MKRIKRDAVKTILVQSPELWRRVVASALRAPVRSFDTEYVDYAGWRLVVGFSLSWRKDGKYVRVYVPLNHEEEILEGVWARIAGQLTEKQVRGGLQRIVDESKPMTLTMHNAVADLRSLYALGVNWDKGVLIFDTMLASWTLVTDREHGLKPLTKAVFDYQMRSLSETAPKETVEDRSKPVLKSGPRKGLYRLKNTKRRLVQRVSLDWMQRYAGDDAEYTLRHRRRFKPELKRIGLWPLFKQLVAEDILYIAEMEITGMVVDVPALRKFSKQLKKRIARKAKEIYAMRPSPSGGKEFNIGSVKQLNAVLFGQFVKTSGRGKDKKLEIDYRPEDSDFQIPPMGEPSKKSGLYATGKDVLKQYAADGHDICRMIVEYNSLDTVCSMVSGWLERAMYHPEDGTWRLHGTFNMHGTRTGRLSSQNPNLQNIPVRNKKLPVRKAFKIPPGFLFGDADYSQIELKLLAHFSQDKRMLRVFKNKGDLHSDTAKTAFALKPPRGLSMQEEGKWIKEHHDEQRTPAKNTNFAIVFGAGPKTISWRYDIPLDIAIDLHKKHPTIFPQAHAWVVQERRRAKKLGYVTTLFKRRRYLPDIQLDPYQYPRGSEMQKRVFAKVGAAERQAINTKIQGSAADIILLAMRNVRRFFRAKKLWMKKVFPVLQVHDELGFYLYGPRADVYMKHIVKLMNDAVTLTVSTEADGACGKSWWAAKEAA